MIVEICASNFESAAAAQQGGADRIELCSRLDIGGLTPSLDLLRKVMDQIDIPVHVLVRPRGGDFVYSEEEINEMLNTIAHCQSLGCSGIVTGALTSEGNIDLPKTSLLKEASGNMHFTFHRAFDHCNHPFQSLEELISLEAETLLTSGQKSSAVEGIELLKTLKERAAGRLHIMPGAGVNDKNAHHFANAKFEAIHLSGIAKDSFKPAGILEGISGVSDINTIKKVVEICR